MEPFNGRELAKWLVSEYRATLLSHSDAMWSAYQLASGDVIVVPGPSAAKHPVATGTLRKVATSLGRSYEELREAMGHPLIKHTRPKPVAVRTSAPKCSRSDVTSRIADVRRALIELEAAVKPGSPRDPAFYLSLHSRLSAAHADVTRAVEQATKNGAVHA